MANQYTRPGSVTVNLTQKNNSRSYLQDNLETCQIGIENDNGTIGLKDSSGDYFSLTNTEHVFGELTSGNVPYYNLSGFSKSNINISASGTAIQDDLILTNDFYIGNKNEDGSWKFSTDVSGNLIFQYRTSGSYITRETITIS